MVRFAIPLVLAVFVGLSVVCSKPELHPKDERLFELRVYHPFPGKLEILHDRFRDHTLALFDKHGLESIGYWVTDEADAKLVYIVAFENKAAKAQAWESFAADPDWKKAYENSIEGGRLVEKIDSTLLTTTDYSPAIGREAMKPARVFELRTYQATEGNLAKLDERFRSATMDLFAKHGATNFVYFHVAAGEEGADRALIYMLAHDSKEARDKTFAAFRKDPDWKKARALSEAAAGGPLNVRGGSKSQMLSPLDYSKIQ